MQIFAKGLDGKTATIDVTADETIETIKKKIQDKLDIEPDAQNLIYSGKQLKDDGKLSDYYIQNNTTIHVAAKLRGGFLF